MDYQQLERSASNIFVPPALAPLNIKPEDCKLVVNYEKSINRTRFTFTVSWTDKHQEKPKDDNSLVLSIRDPMDERSSLVMCAPRRSPQQNTTQENITCDGPCGHTYPAQSMNLLGRCGHFLCDNCYGLVFNDDGTKGCSNFQCVFATLYDYLPEDYARKAYENHIRKRQLSREARRREHISSSQDTNNPLPSSSMRRRQGGQSCPRTTTSDSVRKDDRGTSCDSQSPLQNLLRFVHGQYFQSSSNRRKGACCTPKSDNIQRTDEVNIPRTDRNSNSSRSVGGTYRRRRLLDELFSDMTATSCCHQGPSSEFELLNIRLMIFEPGPFKTIKRIHISHEMSAAMTLKKAIDELVEKRIGSFRHECPSRLFFCADSGKGGLRKITIEEFETARLWQYPARNSVLHFVLDAVGYLKAVD